MSRERTVDGLLISLVAAAILLCPMSELRSDPILIPCGDTDPDSSFRRTDYGVAKVRIIWYTWPSVINATNGTPYLPSYADSMAEALTDFFEWQSGGDLEMDLKLLKPAADSTMYWEVPDSATSGLQFYQMHDSLRNLVTADHPDWADSLCAEILISTSNYPGTQVEGRRNGTLCAWYDPLISPHPSMRILEGSISNDVWNRNGRAFVQAMFVHEMGHMVGAVHLEDGRGGTSPSCNGTYHACYGVMQPTIIHGCGYDDPDVMGLVPYHPWNLIKIGWCDVDTITSSEEDYELGDVRRHGKIVKIPKAGTSLEYFLLVNHQRTKYDDILNGRGLLIWHVRNMVLGDDGCGWSLDLEHPRMMFESEDSPYWCRDYPLAGDAEEGVDALDCENEMLSSAFWPGVGITPDDTFGENSNPSTKWYADDPDDRRHPQNVSSGISFESMKSVIDSTQLPEQMYKVRFDIVID